MLGGDADAAFEGQVGFECQDDRSELDSVRAGAKDDGDLQS